MNLHSCRPWLPSEAPLTAMRIGVRGCRPARIASLSASCVRTSELRGARAFFAHITAAIIINQTSKAPPPTLASFPRQHGHSCANALFAPAQPTRPSSACPAPAAHDSALPPGPWVCAGRSRPRCAPRPIKPAQRRPLTCAAAVRRVVLQRLWQRRKWRRP